MGERGGKADMDRVGLFQEMGYISINDRYKGKDKGEDVVVLNAIYATLYGHKSSIVTVQVSTLYKKCRAPSWVSVDVSNTIACQSPYNF